MTHIADNYPKEYDLFELKIKGSGYPYRGWVEDVDVTLHNFETGASAVGEFRIKSQTEEETEVEAEEVEAEAEVEAPPNTELLEKIRVWELESRIIRFYTANPEALRETDGFNSKLPLRLAISVQAAKIAAEEEARKKG